MISPSLSLFLSCRDTTPTECVSLSSLAEKIRNPSSEVVQSVANIRALLAAGEKDAADKIKRTLPAVTLSGSFYTRKAEAIEEHSGLLAADFDKLQAKEMEDAWKKIIADPYIAIAFRSPSGTGIKAALRVPVADNGAEHLEAFTAAERYFLEVHGLTLDPSGKDVCRLCFLSHDPEAVHNPEAEVLDVAKWPSPILQIDSTKEDSGGEIQFYTDNDAGRAERFCDRWKDEIRFIPDLGIWLTWEERWMKDITGGLKRRAITLANEIIEVAASQPAKTEKELKSQADAIRQAAKWGNKGTIDPMLSMAEANSSIQIRANMLDSDPFLIGAPNAIINLRTGEAFEHRPTNMVTMFTRVNFDAEATAPRWEKFIEEIFPDPELRRYQWKAFGYAATGATGEKCFHFLIGAGNNGKSKQCEAIEWVLGDYSGHAAKGLLCANEKGGYPLREAATIIGKRFIVGPETEAKERLNVGVIKALTGHGDTMRAANLYENQHDFIPVGKLFVMGNHKPSISDTGSAIWSRVRLIPYERVFQPHEQDRGLGEKLKSESSGILNWLIRGALLWQKEGLEPPAKVLAAVEEYRREEDTLADFLEERTEQEAISTVPHSAVFKAYQEWAHAEGIRFPLSSRSLAKGLRAKGWVSVPTPGTRTAWRGVVVS